jgi:glycosyltransferase involved in cell wall biosynthesis
LFFVNTDLYRSNKMMRIIATVTNDLNYDQRMHRICTSLIHAGYDVLLVGRVLPDSIPLNKQEFSMVRLHCWFNKGPLFYLEYNLRLFFFLLLNPFDAVNIVDLDTMVGGYLAATLRGKKTVYDAHEYFIEVPELTDRPMIKGVWAAIGRFFIPKCDAAYTVGPALAAEHEKVYGRPFGSVRNIPLALNKYQKSVFAPSYTDLPYLLYQGALNDGRGLQEAIAAMPLVSGLRLLIAGEGDLSSNLRSQVTQLGLHERVIFLGRQTPAQLKEYTCRAWLGLNLLEHKGQSYYFSLANKFFDYIMHGVPSLNMDFPEYRAIMNQYEVGVLLSDLRPQTIANAVNSLQENEKAHRTLRQACLNAAEEFCWEREVEILLSTWLVVFKA